MSFNRPRNVFTLAPQENCKRRQFADPFERDPFKIHSYNFRYADRPAFQMPVLQQGINHKEFIKDCQTYFYNYNFPTASNSKAARNVTMPHDKTKISLTKFQEHRRRKFLNETETTRNLTASNLNGNAAASKLLNAHCGTGYEKMSQRLEVARSNNSLAHNCSQASVRNVEAQQATKPSLTPLPTMRISAHHIPSLASGCEISIDIKSLNTRGNSQHENVHIKIETDPITRNSNNIFNKTGQNSNVTESKVEQQVKSDHTFIVGKRDSKILSNPHGLTEGREDIKDLTAIYSSRRSLKSPQAGHVKSVERLPSLIPFRPERSSSKENFSNKNFENSSTSTYGNKARQHNSNRSVYNSTYGGIKASNGLPLAARQSYGEKLHKVSPPSRALSELAMASSSKRIDLKSKAPMRMPIKAKLPLNVTINVITDKLKLIKV